MNQAKLILLLFGIIFFSTVNLAQKPSLDFSAIEKWPTLGIRKITADGKFILFGYGSPQSGYKMVVQEATGSWRKELPGITEGYFTGNGRFAIFPKGRDTLLILTLGTNFIEEILNVESNKVPEEGEAWIAYVQGPNKDLHVRDLVSGRNRQFSSVVSYQFMPDGMGLLVQSKVEKYQLHFLRLGDGSSYVVWEGLSKADNICVSNAGQQVAFVTEDSIGDHKGTYLHYFIAGKQKEKVILTDTSLIDSKFRLTNQNNLPQFSKDGRDIFFAVSYVAGGQNTDKSNEGNAAVTVWNTEDAKLRMASSKLKSTSRSKVAAFNLGNNRVMIVAGINDEIIGDLRNAHDNLILVRQSTVTPNEYAWNPTARTTVMIVDTNNGNRAVIKKGVIPSDLGNYRLSPGGRYIAFYDMELRNYFSYCIEDSSIKNITASIPYPLYDEEHDLPSLPRPVNGPVWLQNEEGVLIHDFFDLWLVDPAGKKTPINITRSYGRQHKVILRLIDPGSQHEGVKTNATLVFAALDKSTKETGFFKKRIGGKGEPMKLTMGPYIYYYPKFSWVVNSLPPVKAKAKDVYLVERMSPTESSNIFLSSDLVHYKALTNLQPHAAFNWMNSELVRWKSFDNNIAEGVIYKPENFDSTKKYPVLFSVYEKFADELYSYKTPQFSDGRLDIAYFVSNGYIVFTPSIHYKIGEPGPSAYNTIVSAAANLSKQSWVDSTKMGIQGVSFGGYEVNFVISQTNVFAAAAESAGPVNFVSGYGSIRPDGTSYQFIYETFQSRIGGSLWEKPELYIKNSPIFFADRIRTPLLIMHNPNDAQVPFQQAIELFTALRRLKRNAWMLQYDNEGHGVRKPINQRDYSQKLVEYFDHFLKGAPAPSWMTKGVPARLKQIETGFELDPAGNCGKDCKVCKTWNERWAKDSVATKQLIEKEEKNQWMGLLDTVKPKTKK